MISRSNEHTEPLNLNGDALSFKVSSLYTVRKPRNTTGKVFEADVIRLEAFDLSESDIKVLNGKIDANVRQSALEKLKKVLAKETKNEDPEKAKSLNNLRSIIRRFMTAPNYQLQTKEYPLPLDAGNLLSPIEVASLYKSNKALIFLEETLRANPEMHGVAEQSLNFSKQEIKTLRAETWDLRGGYRHADGRLIYDELLDEVCTIIGKSRKNLRTAFTSLQKSHLDIPTARAWAYFSNEITPLHIASWVNPVFRRSAYYLAKIQPVPTLESYGELEDLLDPEWEDSLGKIEYGELDRKYIIETLAQESGWKEKDLKDDICLSDIFPYENDIGLKLFTLFPDVDQLLRFPNNATLLELINLIENRSDS